jgi:ketosteroid isomerase-like protein
MEALEETVRQFWRHFDAAEFERAGALLHTNFTALMPNTRERYPDSASFIAFNRAYPGRWYMEIERLQVIGDEVVSVVRVFDRPRTASFHAITFFKVEDGLIVQLTEYWSEDMEPPEWRKSLGISQDV